MFSENLDVFLNDFGIEALWKDTRFLGVFDMPDEIIAQGVVLTTDYLFTVKSSDIVGIRDGDTLTIKNEQYFVRNIKKIDSGDFSILSLHKGE